MSNIPASYKIKDQYKLTTFSGLYFQVLSEDDEVETPIDITDWTITSDFRINTIEGGIVKALSIGDGITVLDAVNGEFQIDSFFIDWESAPYFYDIKFVLPDGSTQVYLQGTLTVIENITD